MNWVEDILAGGAAKIIDSVAGVADRFITTGDEKNQFKVEVAKLVQQRTSEIEQTIRTELSEKASIIRAEMASGDKFTQRARPMVVYFGLFVIFWNYCLVPTVSVILKSEAIMFDLPTEFWVAWGGIVSTWVVGRSAEKRGAQENSLSSAITGTSGLDKVGKLLE